MLNYDSAEAYIHSLTRFGSQLGLERMEELLRRLGNPHKKQRFIHIAGTNGKGSTANMCAKVLQDAGYTTGLYTSPFVNDFRERFQIDGNKITPGEFGEICTIVIHHIEAMKFEMGMQVTEFEAVTAIAFVYFFRHKCNIVCLEVGLGGRFDATNIIGIPEIAIITSISLDHVAILGDTIEKIAFEKAGIIKEGTTVVSYPLQEEVAFDVIKQRCKETNSTLIIPDVSAVGQIEANISGTVFNYKNRKYHTLAGEHQAYNTAMVIEAMEALKKKGYVIPDGVLNLGIGKTKPPARVECVTRGQKPPIYLDGAHNYQAVSSLSKLIPTLEKKTVIVMGMMADKDYEHSIECIAKIADTFIAVDVNNPRAEKRAVLAKTASKYCKNVFDIEDYDEVITKAISQAGEDGAIVVCGSFYLVSDMKKAISKHLKANPKSKTK